MFKTHPKHDFSSHFADAFRYLALAWKEEMAPKPIEKPKFPLDQTFDQIRDRAKRRREQQEHY